MSSADRLRPSDAARERPDAPALADDAGVLPWRAVGDEVRRRAAALRAAGLEPARGDRVLVSPTPSREGALTLLALLELDATFALAHPRWSPREHAEAVARTAPRLVLDDARVRAAYPPTERAPEPLAIIFTSGSTGRAKGVRLSRAALAAAARAHAAALPWQPDDRWLLAMPLAHVGGLSILTRALWARAAVAVGPARFDPAALVAAAARHDATLLSLVPTMLERLLAAQRPPPPRLRAALLGGAACPPELLARGRAAGWPLLPTYGTSETCAQVCTQRLGDERPDGVGPPLPGLSVRIVDGEIQVAGPTLLDGFLDEVEPPLEDGWYRTGDLGHLDDAGHLHVTGRADQRIVSGGENVDPLEVERALRSHPAVADACVVGVPDRRWGQRVAAAVVAPGADEASLLHHLRDRLAGFKHPRRWVFLDALPATPSGKTDRAAVRSLLRGEPGGSQRPYR